MHSTDSTGFRVPTRASHVGGSSRAIGSAPAQHEGPSLLWNEGIPSTVDRTGSQPGGPARGTIPPLEREPSCFPGGSFLEETRSAALELARAFRVDPDFGWNRTRVTPTTDRCTHVNNHPQGASGTPRTRDFNTAAIAGESPFAEHFQQRGTKRVAHVPILMRSPNPLRERRWGRVEGWWVKHSKPALTEPPGGAENAAARGRRHPQPASAPDRPRRRSGRRRSARPAGPRAGASDIADRSACR
jgi:hypothetical protein